MIRLLIVDDSALMRRHLSQIFEETGKFIIRHARTGAEAVVENREFQPDVITLDVNMPEMDGLSALSLIMAERPVPVVMVSSLTSKGALATFEAMNLGAIDFIPKPDGTISLSVTDISEMLLQKVTTAVSARLRKSSLAAKTSALSTPTSAPAPARRESVSDLNTSVNDKVVLIGVSTGGPRTLEEILPQLPANLNAPVLIAQHMPASFTQSLASRLDRVCRMSVTEVSRSTELHPGVIYIGRGDADITLMSRQNRLYAQIKPEDPQYRWHPSVELLGLSALRYCKPSNVMAILLTGMGHDGSDSFAELHRKGASTIAESEETAIVFGMPAELIEKKGAGKVLPAGHIATQIINWAGSA